MQYFNSKSNKKAEDKNIIDEDKNLLGTIDMFNFDKAKSEPSFTERKFNNKNKNNEKSENQIKKNIDDTELDSSELSKENIFKKLKSLDEAYEEEPYKKNNSSKESLEPDRDIEPLDDDIFSGYKIGGKDRSIEITEDEFEYKKDLKDASNDNSEKFFEEIDTDDLNLDNFDINEVPSFDVKSRREEEVFKETLYDESMSISYDGYEDYQWDNPSEEFDDDDILERTDYEEDLEKSEEEENFDIEEELNNENELDFNDLEEPPDTNKEKFEDIKDEREIVSKNENDMTVENDLEDSRLEVENDDEDLDLNNVENYFIENSFPKVINEKDLIKFISRSNAGEIIKIKIVLEGKEVFYFSSSISKILHTEALLLLEQGKVEKSVEIFEWLCIYSIDSKVSNLAIVKLKKLLGSKDPVKLNSIVSFMCEKEQDLLKILFNN